MRRMPIQCAERLNTRRTDAVRNNKKTRIDTIFSCVTVTMSSLYILPLLINNY